MRVVKNMVLSRMFEPKGLFFLKIFHIEMAKLRCVNLFVSGKYLYPEITLNGYL